jgi:hypothetical protein
MKWSKLPPKYQRILDDIYVTLQYVHSKGTADDIKTASAWARDKTAWVMVHYADDIRENQSFYMFNGQAVSTAVQLDPFGSFPKPDEVTDEN